MAESEFAAIDEQRFQAFHWRTTLTTGLGVFCDGYDLSCLSLVLPEVLDSFGHITLTGLQSATLSASALVGSIAGALAFGVSLGSQDLAGLVATAPGDATRIDALDLYGVTTRRFARSRGVRD